MDKLVSEILTLGSAMASTLGLIVGFMAGRPYWTRRATKAQQSQHQVGGTGNVQLQHQELNDRHSDRA
jgi:hypothetical protein